MSAESTGREIPSGRAVGGVLRPPPSKSVTQRYLNLALLSEGATCIRRPLLSDDTRHYLEGLRGLGMSVKADRHRILLHPGPLPAAAEIDCGAGGTMLRFLTAALTGLPGSWILDGTEGLRRRPVGALVDGLRSLGAEIRYLDRRGHPPLAVRGGSLDGGSTQLDAGESSQYLSALLMAATRARRPCRVQVLALTSAPYLALTLDALRQFGADLETGADGGYEIRPGPLAGGEVEVEGDWSAACYPAAAALLSAGRVEIRGVRASSRQGDRRFLDLLERMGARIDWSDDGVRVRGEGALDPVDGDLSEMPDQVPTLAALAPFARGTTRIRNVAHLRLKESDRLRAMTTELRRLGAEVRERPDGLEIEGVWSRRRPPADTVRVDSHHDHRIAMSLALVGLRRPGVVVESPGVVTKSYPGFWKDLESLLRA